MTPAELQQLLITRAPDVPGITAAARRDDENPYGLTVTLAGGGRAWWTITGASPAGTVPDPPVVRYGATIGFRDGWKLFLSCYGTTRPGQPRPDHPYHPASHI